MGNATINSMSTLEMLLPTSDAFTYRVRLVQKTITNAHAFPLLFSSLLAHSLYFFPHPGSRRFTIEMGQVTRGYSGQEGRGAIQ